ncbi:MAG: hypothetical protein WD187_01750 [Candidatus Woykebacteria bacterium]
MKLKVEKNQVYISDLIIEDAEVASIVEGLAEKEKAETVRKALKVGLIAMKNVGVTENVDYVEKEFSKVKNHVEKLLEDTTTEIDNRLDKIFSENGVMPLVLKEYLGEGGKLQDLFDENQRNSALGKLSDIFKRHFEGDGSVIYKLLDSSDPGSPIFRLKKELTDKIDNIEKALKIKEAVAEVEEKGTAKGVVYQDLVLQIINNIAKILDDNVIDTSNINGKILNSKTGDVLSKINPHHSGGNSLSIVLEAKDQQKTLPSILKELDEAKQNRDAQVAIGVFSKLENAPGESGNFRAYPGGRILCVFDKETKDSTALEVAYKFARLEALNEIKTEDKKVNLVKLEGYLGQIRSKINSISSIKSSLSSIGTGIEKTKGNLEDLKLEVFSIVDDMADEISKDEKARVKTKIVEESKPEIPIDRETATIN